MKKIILISLIAILILGCTSNLEDNKYSDLEQEINDLKILLEQKNKQIEQYRKEVSLKESDVNRLKEKLKDKEKELDQENWYLEYYEKHFKPSKSPEESKEIIYEKGVQAINALANKDYEELSNLTHPLYGIRFTPYTNIDIENDLVFSKDEILEFKNSDIKYEWGFIGESNKIIELSPNEYFDKYVYDKDYINAEEVGYNEIISSTGFLENQFGIYHNSIIIEYYFSILDPYNSDWRSLRIVFQEHKGEWYIAGLIHFEWIP